ncbi:tetratricopeptide repeat protein [Streptomyces sp. NPDC088116]|uniref:tetratricopeptide repeat protein n=1 Tax=Streptomyces sp. NPDC088116 TaxID=3365825 RepID=UPI003801DD6C
MNPMKTEQVGQVGQVKRAALAAGVGAVLVGGVLLFVPDEIPAPAPGPEARAMAATGTGVRAALTDLTALINNREAWVREHPEDGGAWALLGQAYVQRGVRLADSADYPKADRALRRALAVRSAGAGGRGEAGAHAKSGVDAKPGGPAAAHGNAEALTGLASLANARHDFATARKWGEALRKQDPARWATYPVLIDAYNGLGDYRAAGRALDRLTKLHSGVPVLTRSTAVLRDLGRREDAAAKADEAVALAKTPAEKAEALHTLGELAWERGEPAEALKHYDAALIAEHGRPGTLAGRARALAALSRTDEAYHDYQTALEKLPRPEYALELGELYDSAGLDGDARTQYAVLAAQTTKARRDGVNEALVLARFEADHGNPRAAVVRLRAEWKHGRRSMEVADALGWALFRAGHGKEALTYAKKATDQGLRSALFSYHRGEIERSLAMNGPARRHIEEALRTNPHFSPLLAPKARAALEELGEPEEGGPRDMYEDTEPGGAEPGGTEPGGTEPEGAEPGGAEPPATGTAQRRTPASAPAL